MKTSLFVTGLLACALLASCRDLASLNSPMSASASTTPPAPAPSAGTLYARDGSVVSDGSKGTGRVESEPMREIGEGEGSRASMLELYTKAVESRNALTVDVENLKAALEEERRAATTAAEERAALRTEIAQLTAERDALKGETLDLAARLTTAQIARLEAQKSLLEAQIDARMREEAAASAHAAPQGSSKDKRRAGGDHP